MKVFSPWTSSTRLELPFISTTGTFSVNRWYGGFAFGLGGDRHNGAVDYVASYAQVPQT